MNPQSNSSRRILGSDESGPVAAIKNRRSSAMVALLGKFEREIEPLIPPGNEKAIKDFKGDCRKKINGLAYAGISAAEALPGESVSTQTPDLAADLAFTDQED